MFKLLSDEIGLTQLDSCKNVARNWHLQCKIGLASLFSDAAKLSIRAECPGFQFVLLVLLTHAPRIDIIKGQLKQQQQPQHKINGLLSHVVFLTKYSVYQIIRVQIVAQEWTL